MKPTLLIGAMGLVLTGFFGYHTVYAPQQGRVRVIQAKLAARQSDQQAQQEAAVLLEQYQKYRQRLPENPDPSWLASEVLAIGRKAGLEITSVTQETPQPFQQFTRLAVTLQFSASYHQLGAFLDELERSDHFILVDQLALTGSKKAGDPGTVRLLLSSLYVPSALTASGPPAGRKP